MVGSEDGIHSFGNTLLMARIVQEWIDLESDPFNAGFIIVDEDLTKGWEEYVKYSGAENAPDLIPRLVVTYTAPSQGKEHRDYTAYLPEVPQSLASSMPASAALSLYSLDIRYSSSLPASIPSLPLSRIMRMIHPFSSPFVCQIQRTHPDSSSCSMHW